MNPSERNTLAILAAVFLAGCGSSTPPPDAPPPVLKRVADGAAPLLRFGIDSEGMLSRAKVVAGLKKEFAVADTNGDGVLELNEANAVNDLRQKRDGVSASILRDWNRNGEVDFNEFATTDLSLFEQYDFDGNGILTPPEFAGVKRNLKS